MAREGKERFAWQEKEKRDLHSKRSKGKIAWQEKEKRDLHGKRRKRDISIARDGKER